MITFLYPWVFFIGLPLIMICFWWSVTFRKRVTYQFPLTHLFKKSHTKSLGRTAWQTFVPLIRWVTALFLLCVIARPQYPDKRSKITVEGVATMLVLDVSGSMESFDDLNNRPCVLA